MHQLHLNKYVNEYIFLIKKISMNQDGERKFKFSHYQGNEALIVINSK